MQDIELKIHGGKLVVIPTLQKINKLLNMLDGFNCTGEVTEKDAKILFYKTGEFSVNYQISIIWDVDFGTYGTAEIYKGTLRKSEIKFNFAPNGMQAGADDENFRFEYHNLKNELIKCRVI